MNIPIIDGIDFASVFWVFPCCQQYLYTVGRNEEKRERKKERKNTVKK
jgi:hypothetical protein